MDPIITIKQLAKRYRHAKQFSLKGIDLSINRGDFFGLLGPNGSGKTTLISILCGLLSATEGNIEVNGKRIPSQLKSIKSFIGLVPQEIALYPTLTLNQNLQFFASLYNLPQTLIDERMKRLIKLASLERFRDEPIQTFSGGMKRRANLIVSLMNEPEILFLDEPTVNVDPQSRQVIYDILHHLNSRGMTLIYTTHYLEEVERMCKNVAIIDHGRLLCRDTPANLIKGDKGGRNLADVFFNYTGRALRD